ncbi:hypothetical protein [Kitasatospora viridis]|nr:hypothetical protein [Kitasatospora viridis]
MTDDQDQLPARLERTARSLPDGLEQVVELFPAHSPDLALRAAARGRRLRRVRQAWLGGALAVLVTGVGLLTAQAMDRDADGVVRPGPATGVTVAPSPTGPPTAPPTSPPTDSPAAPSASPLGYLPANEQLAALLPEHGTLSSPGGTGGLTPDHTLSSGPGGGTVMGWFDFTDAHGTATVQVTVVDDDPAFEMHSCAGWLASSCQKLGDGTVVLAYSNRSGDSAQRQWFANAIYSGGRSVLVSELVRSSTGGQLALSPVELRTLALSPQWKK